MQSDPLSIIDARNLPEGFIRFTSFHMLRSLLDMIFSAMQLYLRDCSHFVITPDCFMISGTCFAANIRHITILWTAHILPNGEEPFSFHTVLVLSSKASAYL